MKRSTKSSILWICGATLTVISIVGLSYYGYLINRWFNWKYAYGDQVKQMIVETVKKECLK